MKLINTAVTVLQTVFLKATANIKYSPFEGLRKDIQFAQMRRELRKSVNF